MAKRDPERTQRMRIAVRYLLERDCLAKGNQSRLAEHFHVSRQRVHQIVVEEKKRLARTISPRPLAESAIAVPAQASVHPFVMRSHEQRA
jgi:hypothetical protein